MTTRTAWTLCLARRSGVVIAETWLVGVLTKYQPQAVRPTVQDLVWNHILRLCRVMSLCKSEPTGLLLLLQSRVWLDGRHVLDDFYSLILRHS